MTLDTGVFLLAFPVLPTHPLPGPPSSRNVFVPSFCCLAVCWFCFVALFVLHSCSSAKAGFRMLSPLPFPLSFPLFCLLVVCFPCLFSALVVSPVFLLLVLLTALAPCRLPPPLVCVCARVKPQSLRCVGVGVLDFLNCSPSVHGRILSYA